ncbi:DNA repair protein RecO [Mycoplasmopsis pulmonis]|uniref:DNA repair protein RecO n=1 Tax=Mycoplasmopsis pulmonis TaxID=2107 RepID=UPI002ACE40EC|nr:DNA repair protein RecO [Mycoplasmopsis pulmonis]MDZ7293127.1 DNA repair protein RecO [Mycoplasmopsis pulmonis]
MAEIIKKGILLSVKDYSEHDVILKVLFIGSTEAILAKGIRKIESKNRSNLIVGSIVEFIYFKARLETKISRLKKASLIQLFDFTSVQNQFLFQTIFHFINQLTKIDEYFFQSYSDILNYQNKDCNSHIITFLYFRAMKSLGIEPNFSSCYRCGSFAQIVNVKVHEGGFLCSNCSLKRKPIRMLKNFYYLTFTFKDYLRNTTFDENEIIKQELISYLEENGFYFGQNQK